MSNSFQVTTRLVEQMSPHFDTSQKPNQKLAVHSFDKDFIQKLQEDGLTWEMLEAIPRSVPTFKYFDKVAIHGRFPKSQVDRVMDNRHGVQFQTDLLLLNYNQIDVAKKKALNEMLQFVGIHKKKCVVPTLQEKHGVISFQLADVSYQIVKQVYDRIDTSLFYGRKEIIEVSHPSGELGTFYILYISLGAMKQANLWAIFFNWTGVSEKQYNTLKNKVKAAQSKENQELIKEEEEKQQRCEENYNKALSQLKRFQPWAGVMNNNIILVSGLKEEDSPGFIFVKIQEGRADNITLYIQSRAELKDFDPEYYPRTKRSTLSNLKEILSARNWFVYDVGDLMVEIETQPQPVQPEQEEESEQKFELFHYSASAVVLFGDTTAYEEMLYAEPFNGVPNFKLTHPATNENTFGWTFSNDSDTIEAIEKEFSITIKTNKSKAA
jgi:ribosomal silencing factor RsfS